MQLELACHQYHEEQQYVFHDQRLGLEPVINERYLF
jgi:hypothetical protein